jgi:pimeloyl-ACP methyl ester carboxylesterase
MAISEVPLRVITAGPRFLQGDEVTRARLLAPCARDVGGRLRAGLSIWRSETPKRPDQQGQPEELEPPGPLPLDKITAPTLIISARDDLFNTLPAAEYAASRIPGAKLIVYENGGHLLVGHEMEVRDAVRSFLALTGLVL